MRQRALIWQRVQREFASVGMPLSSSAISSSCTSFPRPFRASCEAVKRRGAVLLTPKANLFGGNQGHHGINSVIVVQTTGSALAKATRNQAQVIKLGASDLSVVVISNVVVSYWRGPTTSKVERVIEKLKNLTSG